MCTGGCSESPSCLEGCCARAVGVSSLGLARLRRARAEELVCAPQAAGVPPCLDLALRRVAWPWATSGSQEPLELCSALISSDAAWFCGPQARGAV